LKSPVRMAGLALPALAGRVVVNALAAADWALDAVQPAPAHHVIAAVLPGGEVADCLGQRAGVAHNSGVYPRAFPPSSIFLPLKPDATTVTSISPKKLGIFWRRDRHRRVSIYRKQVSGAGYGDRTRARHSGDRRTPR